jgi:hypothetical protein
MRTEQEIRDMIKQTEELNSHVLKGSFATIVENAPRALIQLAAKSRLEGLYYALDENCPKYEYEKHREE